MVELRHQLAAALASRDSQHATAERADAAAEDIAAQYELLSAELDEATAERDSLSLQLAMAEDAREAAEAQATELRRSIEVGLFLPDFVPEVRQAVFMYVCTVELCLGVGSAAGHIAG